MTNTPYKQNGSVNIRGSRYKLTNGTRAQVWHGTAFKTRAGLKKSDFMQNHKGRIVSRKKHFTAKREKRLERAGYKTKRGVFQLSRRMK